MRGPKGLLKSARPGQIVVEFGSHPVPVKQQYVAPLLPKGRHVSRRRGERHARHGGRSARASSIWAAPEAAGKKIEPIVAAFADLCLYLGDFGAATKVKLVNNFLVALHIAGTAQAMALGLKTGVDQDLLIKAVATGSGGSTQFGIRAPGWRSGASCRSRARPQASRIISTPRRTWRTRPASHTDLLDCLIEIFARRYPVIGERDVAAMLESFESKIEN